MKSAEMQYTILQLSINDEKMWRKFLVLIGNSGSNENVEERLSLQMKWFMNLGTISVLLLTSVCFAEDWNQFRGSKRDGRSMEKHLLDQWPKNGPPVLWTFKGLGRGYATVSIVDGIIYTTGMIDETGYLFAIHENGDLKWKKAYGPEWTGPYPGTRTTPTIDGDRVYIMSGLGLAACYNKDSGDRIWRVDTLGKFEGENITWGISESLLIDGDKVICTPGGKMHPSLR